MWSMGIRYEQLMIIQISIAVLGKMRGTDLV